jgi:glucose-1-phosphate adenylyltransferase
MDLLADPPPLNLNDRGWVIHTRTEERPPMRIASGTTIEDSMISDGCIIEAGALVQSSVLSPGVIVRAGAKVCQSVVLTDTIIERGATLCRAIVDKRVRVGENARIGSPEAGATLAVCGKNAEVPAETVVEPGAVIGTDVIASDYSSRVVRSNEILQTQRQPYEI